MEYVNWGLISYKDAWDRQLALFNERLEAKSQGRQLPDLLVFCEHPPVYTLGKSGVETNLLIGQQRLHDLGVEFFHADRGGILRFMAQAKSCVIPFWI